MAARLVPEMTAEQRVGGALYSLVLALSYGGYDVHGGVPVSAVDVLGDGEVCELVLQEMLRAVNMLAFDEGASRENAWVSVRLDFNVDPPRDRKELYAVGPSIVRTMRAADQIADRRPAPRTLLNFYSPEHHADAVPPSVVYDLRLAFSRAAGPTDHEGDFLQRLVHAAGEALDRTVRLRVRCCEPVTDHDARRLATAMIRSRFSQLGLDQPDQPAVDDFGDLSTN